MSLIIFILLINSLGIIPTNSLTDTRILDHAEVGSSSQFWQDPISDHIPHGPSATTTHSRNQSVDVKASNDESQEGAVCNFGGRTMRVAIAPQPPFVDCLQDSYGEWFCNGSNIEVVRVLESRLNFRAEWIVLANGHFNEIDAPKLKRPAGASKRALKYELNLNESHMTPGVFGLVGGGRAMLSANGVMRTLDRNGHNLLVSEPFDSFKLHFLLSKSVRDHDHIFIKPFELRAWVGIFVSAALMVPIFYFINTTSAYYYTKDDRALSRVSLWQCIQHLARTKLRPGLAPKCGPMGSINRRTSSSASCSSDESLDKVISEFVSSKESFGMSMIQLKPMPPRGELKRKRRLLKRQWSLERRRAKRMGRLMRQSGFFRVAYVIWYVVASLANQGGETEDLPHATSTRILVAFWWLYLIVICAIHSGILTAILTFPKQMDFIRTLDDYFSLAPSDRMDIKLAVDKYSELAHLLSDVDNLHKSPLQMLQRESVPLLFVDFNRHRQRILDDIQLGHCALIEERSIINRIITQEYLDSRQSKCLFKASRFPVDIVPMSMVLSTKMPANCVELINSILRRIMMTGLAQKWRRKYDSLGNDCLNTVVINAGDVDKIELKHVVLAFWLLLISFAVGSLFLIAEIIWLFMVEGEEDEGLADSSCSSSDSSSSSSSANDSSSSTSSSDHLSQVQLGHRRAQLEWSQRDQAIRSLQTSQMKSILRRARRQQRRKRLRQSRQPTGADGMRLRQRLPTIAFNLDEHADQDADQGSQLNFDNVDDDLDVLSRGGKGRINKAEERRRRRLAKAAERRSRRLHKTVDFFRRVHGGKIYSDTMRNRVRRASHAIVTKFTGSSHQDSRKPRRPVNGRVAPL